MPPKKIKPQPIRKAHSVSEESDYELNDTLEEESYEMQEEEEDQYEDEPAPAPSAARKRGKAPSRADREEEEDEAYQPPSRKVVKKPAFKKPVPKQPPAKKPPPPRKQRVQSPKKPDYYEQGARKSRNEVISEEELPVMNMATKPDWIYCTYDLGFGHIMKMCKVRVTKEDDNQFDFDALQCGTKGNDDFKYNMKIEVCYAMHDALGDYIKRLEAAKNKDNAPDFDYDD